MEKSKQEIKKVVRDLVRKNYRNLDLEKMIIICDYFYKKEIRDDGLIHRYNVYLGKNGKRYYIGPPKDDFRTLQYYYHYGYKEDFHFFGNRYSKCMFYMAEKCRDATCNPLLRLELNLYGNIAIKMNKRDAIDSFYRWALYTEKYIKKGYGNGKQYFEKIETLFLEKEITYYSSNPYYSIFGRTFYAAFKNFYGNDKYYKKYGSALSELDIDYRTFLKFLKKKLERFKWLCVEEEELDLWIKEVDNILNEGGK